MERLSASRAFVCCSNILFLMSGFGLMSSGVLLLADGERVLLSRLVGPGDVDQPLFYYAAFGIVGFGFFIAITGILGCWASCLLNWCITGSYLMAIALLVVAECTVCVLAVFWPHLLGVEVRPGRLVRALQRNYALPGREQFTAALDLAQTMFSCCGINGSSNYGTSWWRLQEVGRRELVVPITCCTLNNTADDTEAFLNPEPLDLGLCQALNPAEHQQARHALGCLEMIQKWTQEQALILLAVGLAVLVIEISAVVSTLLACSKISKNNNKCREFTSTQTLDPFGDTDHEIAMGIENRMHMTGTTFGAKS